jgi:ribosomal protein S18 acetylase RimI-like enzyme
VTIRSERFEATGLYYRVADPADERLDSFDLGSTDCAQEEARYFLARGWTGAMDGRECTCLQLVTGGEHVVGYIAFQVVSKAHPTSRSRTDSDYLFPYHLWIAPTHQGVDDMDSIEPARWSGETLRLVETIARTTGCAGVYLNVREDNEPAIKLYRRFEYIDDGGYTSKVTGHAMRRMRKILS